MEPDPQLGLSASGHETSDASVRGVVYTLAGLALGAGLVALLIYGVFRYLADHPLSEARANPMESAAPPVPPAPRIEDHPTIEIEQLHAQEDAILSTYGWTDKDKGIVRIPIDRAMEIEMTRGFPTRGGGK